MTPDVSSGWTHPLTLPIAFVAGAVLCAVAERLWPRQSAPLIRPAWWTDFALTLINGLVVQRAAAFLIAWAGVLGARAVAPDELKVFASAPLFVELPVLLILGDLVFYWVHRAFHRIPALWSLHKVHHASEHLDWLASSRSHVLDYGLGYLVAGLLLGPWGFSTPALALAALFDVLNGMWTHANLPFRLDPLRHLFVTPEFHRWHHSNDGESTHRNFAMVFSFWDRTFGTFHYRLDDTPERFGLLDEPDIAKLPLFRLLARPLTGARTSREIQA